MFFLCDRMNFLWLLRHFQVYFRYQTKLCDDDKTVIDDNRKDPKPLELIFGKKFKLEVWETCLKSMRVDEVASFVVDASVCWCISFVPPQKTSHYQVIRRSHYHLPVIVGVKFSRKIDTGILPFGIKYEQLYCSSKYCQLLHLCGDIKFQDSFGVHGQYEQ